MSINVLLIFKGLKSVPYKALNHDPLSKHFAVFGAEVSAQMYDRHGHIPLNSGHFK